MEPNELIEKPKFNWKRLLITVGIVIITASAIGGSVYYVMNQQAQKDKESAEKTVQDLQKQIDDLKKTETTSTTPSTNATTQTTNSSIYTNEKGKYSFNLIKDIVVSEGIYGCEGLCGQSVEVIKKQTNSAYQDLFITIGYYINPQGTTLTEILNRDENYKNGNATNIKDFTIGGVTGKSFNTPGIGGDSRNYYFIKNNTAYSIVVSEFTRDGQDDALNEILKTFKFN